MVIVEFSKGDPALDHVMEQGGLIWTKEINKSGSRRFITGPLDELIQHYLDEPDKIRDETLWRHLPTRVFYDLDAKGWTAEKMGLAVAGEFKNAPTFRLTV